MLIASRQQKIEMYPFPNKINMKKLKLQSAEGLVGSSLPFFVTDRPSIEMNFLKPFFYRISPRYSLKSWITPYSEYAIHRKLSEVLTYVDIEEWYKKNWDAK